MGAGVTNPPFFAEHDVSVYLGNAFAVLPMLAAGSVNCVVTSPPYYGLRDYEVDGQLGLESTPMEYIGKLRALFREVRRVLRDDGVLWLNLGDSYNAYNGNRGESPTGFSRNDPMPDLPPGAGLTVKGLPAKNMLGIPWRVALALQDDGWVLRNDVIWNKPNAMPESVTDRLACRHEHLFLFSKQQRYWFDLDPVRVPLSYPELADGSRVFGGVNKGSEAGVDSTARRRGGKGWGAVPDEMAPSDRAASRRARKPQDGWKPNSAKGEWDAGQELKGRNPGDVWTIPTTPYPGAHYATFPPELPRRCILAGCPQGGVVLDPFAGSGTTLMVAKKLLRRSIGIELSPKSCDLIVERIGQPAFDFGEVTA